MRAHQPAELQLAAHICPVVHLAGAAAFFLPAANAASETNASERHVNAAIRMVFISSSRASASYRQHKYFILVHDSDKNISLNRHS